jgi:exonuclease III
MRILTWNCYLKSFEQCEQLLARYYSDIIILQECVCPPENTPNCLWIGKDPKKKGLAVYASPRYKLTKIPIIQNTPSYYLPVRVDGPISFNLLAVWTQKASSYIEGMHDIIDLYQDFLVSSETIIVGDFNSNARWDAEHGMKNHSALVQRLHLEYNLSSAYHHFFNESHGQETIPTYYFQWNQGKPFHIDYCFVPSEWCKQIRSVQIGDYESWKKVSDHRPLFIEFETLPLLTFQE